MTDTQDNEIRVGDMIVYIWMGSVLRIARVLEVRDDKICVAPPDGRNRWIFSPHHVALYRDKLR
jgi:hypothetical protein